MKGEEIQRPKNTSDQIKSNQSTRQSKIRLRFWMRSVSRSRNVPGYRSDRTGEGTREELHVRRRIGFAGSDGIPDGGVGWGFTLCYFFRSRCGTGFETAAAATTTTIVVVVSVEQIAILVGTETHHE